MTALTRPKNFHFETTMKTALVLRHVHFEDLGTIAPLLRERGYDIQYVDACIDDLPALNALTPALLVVLGGPIGAFDDEHYPFLVKEVGLVKARLDAGLPILGICLGAQLIARALGAAVAPMGYKEIEFAPVSLTPSGHDSPLAALEGTLVLHWHGDMFQIPEGATRLAHTNLCANQAFSVGSNVLALQFHLEADAGRIEQWLVGHANELFVNRIPTQLLRSQAKNYESQLARVSRKVVGDWLDALEPAAVAS